MMDDGAACYDARMLVENPHDDLLAALIAHGPADLSELEEIVGPLRRDLTRGEVSGLARNETTNEAARAGGLSDLEVEFAHDLYHQDPRSEPNPVLSSYRLGFACGLDQCLGLLERSFGQAKLVRRGDQRVYRFHPPTARDPLSGPGFYVVPDEGGRYSLWWHERVPDFAIPVPDAAATGALVGKLIQFLHGPMTRTQITACFDEPALDEDWGSEVVRADNWTIELSPEGEEQPESIIFHFRPSLPGKDIAAALEVEEPVVVATDVHMTSRIIADWPARAFPRSGRYRVYLHVDADGLQVTDREWPASSVWLAPEIRLHSIEIER
jgi:hypothetical protein